MNVLLLGNGFDLNHMFPTSYINFLNTVNFLLEVDRESILPNAWAKISSKKLFEKMPTPEAVGKQKKSQNAHPGSRREAEGKPKCPSRKP